MPRAPLIDFLLKNRIAKDRKQAEWELLAVCGLCFLGIIFFNTWSSSAPTGEELRVLEQAGAPAEVDNTAR